MLLQQVNLPRGAAEETGTCGGGVPHLRLHQGLCRGRGQVY